MYVNRVFSKLFYFQVMSLENRLVTTATDQTITCSISGLSVDSSVTWIDPDNNEISNSDTNNYVISQGIFIFGSKAPTLTFTTARIAALTSGDTFKCELRSALYSVHSPDVVKSMALSFLTLGRCFFLLKKIFSRPLSHKDI